MTFFAIVGNWCRKENKKEENQVNIIKAEEKIALWLGEIVEMPEKVFRGALPHGVNEGFEVRLVSGIPAGLNRVNEFTLEIKGFSPDRRSLWEWFDRIFAALPIESGQGLLYVDVKGEVHFSLHEKGALQVFCGRVELAVSFV